MPQPYAHAIDSPPPPCYPRTTAGRRIRTMIKHIRFGAGPALISFLALLLIPHHLSAQGTAFTYQGKLNSGGNPAQGTFDLRFSIVDSPGGPNVIAGPITNATTSVSNGLFTVLLDFGPNVFAGFARWLEIGVRTNGSPAAYVTLSPRQQITPTPYAIYAPTAGSAQSVPAGSIGAAQLSSNAVGELTLTSSLLAKVNAFLVWQTQNRPVFLGLTNVTAPAGYPFDFEITASNNPPFTFTSSPLPGGLFFFPSDTFADISGIATNLGNFPVVFTAQNIAGVATGAISLNFTSSPPAIQDTQTNFSSYLHASATLDELVYGYPLAIQWLRNGSPLPSATSQTLTLSNLSAADAGLYTLTASNALSAVSTNIQLNVNNLAVWGFFCDFEDASGTAPAGFTNVITMANNCAILALTADNRLVRWDDTGPDPVMKITNLVALAAGYSHNLALRTNGTVFAWGDNSLGQTNVPATVTNIVAVAAAQDVSVALRADGTLFFWGDDVNDEFTLPPAATNVYAFAKGDAHSVALRADGKVVAWGDDSFGQTDVPSNLSNVVAVAAGAAHTVVLLNNGTVTAWGDPDTTNIPPGLSNIIAIAAGDAVSLALRTNGTVVWWGSDQWSPEDFPTDLTHVVALRATDDNFSALINDNRNLIITGKVNTAFSYQIQPSGRNKYFGIGLPPGLSVAQASGLVSGTVTSPGSWSVLLGTRNAVTNATQVFHLTISP